MARITSSQAPEAPSSSVPPEIDAFLARHTRTMLVTLRPDGSPTIHPMLGLWRDGALWLNTYRKSAKLRNIERDPRVCCLVLGGVDDLTPPAVVLRGHAELMPIGTPTPGATSGGSETLPAGVTPGIVRRVADRVANAKRVVVRVTPDDTTLLA
jgi:PPOX class probable F420-dependent enzyme